MLAPILVKSVLLAVVARLCRRAYAPRVALDNGGCGTLLSGRRLDCGVGHDGQRDGCAAGFRLGIPGMALQIVGGYLFIKYLLRK